MALSAHHLIFFILLYFAPFSSSFEHDPVVTLCSGLPGNSSSAYDSTLHSLLSNLTLSVTQPPYFFSTAVSGEPFPTVFGLAQCNPSIANMNCQFCITSAMNATLSSSSKGCLFNRSGALRYEHCLIRYSDHNFFGSSNDRVWSVHMNKKSAWHRATFKQRATAFLSGVALDAATEKNRYAMGKRTSEGETEWIYGMAWCTMDLSYETCLKCLQQGMGKMDFEKISGQAYGISCALRYDISSFLPVSEWQNPVEVPDGRSSLSNDGPASAAGENGKSTRLQRMDPLISVALAAVLLLI